MPVCEPHLTKFIKTVAMVSPVGPVAVTIRYLFIMGSENDSIVVRKQTVPGCVSSSSSLRRICTSNEPFVSATRYPSGMKLLGVFL